MKRFFELLEDDQFSVDDYIKTFKKSGFGFTPSKIEALGHIKSYTLGNIPVIFWVRNKSATTSQLEKELKDYPRLSFPKEILKLPEESRIDAMLHLCKEHNLHFLVVLPRIMGEELFWFGAYTDIPRRLWKLNYRKRNRGFDRMIITTRRNEMNFVTYDKLKIKFNKCIKNG